jgi:hypothetical protein
MAICLSAAGAFLPVPIRRRMASGSIACPHKIGSHRIEHQGFVGVSSYAGAMPKRQIDAR